MHSQKLLSPRVGALECPGQGVKLGQKWMWSLEKLLGLHVTLLLKVGDHSLDSMGHINYLYVTPALMLSSDFLRHLHTCS